MKICVFCSANEQIDPDFFQATEELGRWAATNGHDIVYGGVNQGLMECLGRAVHEAGGRTIGVVPTLVEKSGRISQYVDIFVALPGGIGTLDEVFTVAASATIGYHQKTVILYNIKDYWHPLIALLNDLQQCGMVRGEWQKYIKVANSMDELESYLKEEISLSSQ